MEHNSFSLDIQLPVGKDTKCYQSKFNHFANVICSIHVVSAPIYIISEIPFWSDNFDMGISYTPIFLSESVV